MNGTEATRPAARRLALFIGLMVLVGLNLRPALSSLAPVLTRIQQDTGLMPLSIGALTTLPVLCLGIFAPLAPWLSKHFGPENTLSPPCCCCPAVCCCAECRPWPHCSPAR
ncbi:MULTISPECIES: hypothetical protein [Halomonas]|uniref:MFS transporter n=1 Tax=Halomonas ventosae TaxID=229007 RepID=A0A4R6HXU2_9GAMM|nr:hypothetical protein DFO68_103187 [Halomonas ventosae]